MNSTLKPDEVVTIQMALAAMIDDVESCAKMPHMPFTPEARKDMNDILTNAKSAKEKIDAVVGNELQLAPFVEGDEQDFFTKQS